MPSGPSWSRCWPSATASGARALVRQRAGVSAEVADQVVAYLAAGLAALGALPTRDRLVVERVFDDSEGTQLIVHSPYGGRINRALGLALRKRFCVSFDFELQAAADDDTVVLSLGPQHSFPLSQVPTMLQSGTVTDVLTQAVLPHPMLAARWRWNLNRALVVPRSRGGQRRPIHLQRMEAEDLLAASWPALAACQENAGPGPVPVPDHVLVRQTVTDCLTEPLDAEGLVGPPRGARDRPGRRPPGRVGGAVAPGPRDPDRAPVHLPRRSAAGGAPDPGRPGAPRPRTARTRRPSSGPSGGGLGARPARPGGHGRGAGPGAAPSPRCRRAPRPPALAGPLPAGRRPGSGGSRPSDADGSGRPGRWRLGGHRATGGGRGVDRSLTDPTGRGRRLAGRVRGGPSRRVRPGDRRGAGGRRARSPPARSTGPR